MSSPGSPRIFSGSRVILARSSSGTRPLSSSRTSTWAISMGAPTLDARYFALAWSSCTTPPPTVPQPSSPMRTLGKTPPQNPLLVRRDCRRGGGGALGGLGHELLLERGLEDLVH